MQASLVDQRRYLSENARSRLRGSNACLRTVAPTLPVRAPSERAGVFLLDHSQVGFAVIFIDDISFFCVEMKKARDLVRALGLGFGWVQPSELYIREISVDTDLIYRSSYLSRRGRTLHRENLAAVRHTRAAKRNTR